MNKKLAKLAKLGKLGKKGILADIGEMIIAGVVIAILGILLTVLLTISADEKQKAFESDMNIIDASYNTRSILQYEIEPGYKLYELIIEAVNTNNYNLIAQNVPSAIDAYSGGDMDSAWFFAVDNYVGSYRADKIPWGAVSSLPRSEIPNPDGKNIKVLIKRISESDYDIELPGVNKNKFQVMSTPQGLSP